ncbi:MAG: radical SAM protein, partial [Planctomycetales bacterium]|nr:radical SAM protein [Planctomycetales bacterium]
METPGSLFARHERTFHDFRFVYPVISRRSGGVSVGVNLNPDKVCNFDCIYCQVDRTSAGGSKFVDVERLEFELEHVLRIALDGTLFQDPKFAAVETSFRRVNDIAFSGDGEPTTYQNFDELIERCAAIKRRLGADAVKMVLITNASMLRRPHVERGLAILDANQGEVWAKLDAGSEEYFALVDRSRFKLRQIVENITHAARARPIVIQSLWMRIHDEPPSTAELDAFQDRLNEITAAGESIKLVQIYTFAR